MTLRAAQESRLDAIWYRQQTPPWYLRALCPAWAFLTWLDRRRQLRSRAADLDSKCIVVVGNITVGGSGKTPLVLRLCELVRTAGLSPAVVSRGYGRKGSRSRLVRKDADVAEVGDEPLLIARRSGVPVMVAADRSQAARELFAGGADVVISDDGLQHLRMPRAFEICVVDGERGLGNGYLLPAGPLRESPERLATVDHIVINGGGLKLPDLVAGASDIQPVNMDIHARKVNALDGAMSWRLSQFSGCKVAAVAGIANPGRFFELLRNSGVEPQEWRFPDHHAFRAEDFAAIPERLPIIMTEKDAVKCTGLGLKNAWYVTIEAFLPHEWEAGLMTRISEFLQQHRGHGH